MWILGVLVVAVIALVAVWNWDWALPFLEPVASNAIGRKVTAQHLHVSLGGKTTISLDDVEIANAPGFDAAKPFAHVDRLTVVADVMAYIRDRQIVIPSISLDHPVIEADQTADKKGNWPIPPSSGTPAGQNADPNAGPKIGALQIHDGQIHADLVPLKADLTIAANTVAGPDGGSIKMDAKGRYAEQPITGQLIAGALLSLRDSKRPYPIDLELANGPTKVSLKGTVENPLNFAGANVDLSFTGPNMGLLTPLTGVPIPQTPAYSVTGKLDYADRKIRFSDFHGKLGESDIGGTISVDPTGAKPFVDADLHSERVQLADLGGFIGETPGRKEEAESPKVKAELDRKEASDSVLPDTPVNLPKLTAANVRLRYRGAHILGRSVPLDNIVADIDIDNGAVNAHPISFAVGPGQIAINAALKPASGHDLSADIRVQFRQVDLGRLLSATHLVQGAGAMSGSASLIGTGDSLAQLAARGNGGLELGMSGGNLSALLVDIAGLEVGNAILSAIGIPQRAQLQCFAVNMPLQHGVLRTHAMILDTSEATVKGAGDVDFANQTINYQLRTASRHFSVGSLPTPIDITGKLAHPSIAPEIGPLAARAGAAVGLGVLFPPLAILPTIQLGTGGDEHACEAAERPAVDSVRPAERRRR